MYLSQKDEPPQFDDAQIDKTNSELSDRESPSPSLAIEGFVQGESDDNQVQSESAAFVNKVKSMIFMYSLLVLKSKVSLFENFLK